MCPPVWAEGCGGVYTVVQKILGPGESVVESWPVAGQIALRVTQAVDVVNAQPRHRAVPPTRCVPAAPHT